MKRFALRLLLAAAGFSALFGATQWHGHDAGVAPHAHVIAGDSYPPGPQIHP